MQQLAPVADDFADPFADDFVPSRKETLAEEQARLAAEWNALTPEEQARQLQEQQDADDAALDLWIARSRARGLFV